MSETNISMALMIPEALIASIDEFAEENKDEGTINRTVVPKEELPSDEDLGFDPITGSVVVWLAVKIIGPAAATVALGLLTNAIYDYLKERAQKDQMYEIRGQCPDGTSITIRSDRPLDMEAIEEFVRACESD